MTINSGAKGIMINANGTLILKGGFTVPSGVTFPLSASGAGKAETPRDVTMNGTLTGQSDSVVQYSVALASAPNVNPALSTLTVSGNASAFKGKYVVADAQTKSGVTYVGLTYLAFTSATAFGDPTSELADAVTLGERTYLSLGASVVQYATRGVTITAGKKGASMSQAARN